MRRRPRLVGPTGGGEPRRKERLCRLVRQHAVARLNRNTTTGAITQPAGGAGCISETGRGPVPTATPYPPRGVAVSPDGKSVYVASAALTLHRSRWPASTATLRTGAISQPVGTAGCVSEDGSGPCADGHGLRGPYSVAVSPDGKSVYVASYESDAVAEAQSADRGDQPAGRKSRLHRPDRRRALHRRACAPRPGVGGGQRRRGECLRDVA